MFPGSVDACPADPIPSGMSTDLHNACTSSLSETQSSHSQLWHVEETHIVSHGAHNDGNLGLLCGTGTGEETTGS